MPLRHEQPADESVSTTALPVGDSVPKTALQDDPDTQRILLRQIDTPATSKATASWKLITTCSSKLDAIVFLVAAISAIIGGALNPVMTIVYGQLAGTFRSFVLGDLSDASFRDAVSQFTLYFVYLGIAEFVFIYIATVGFMATGEHVTQKIRERYLQSILRQNMGFFDNFGAGEITARITSDTQLIQEGLSGKVALSLTALSTFVAAFIISFIKNWKLALILTSTIVVTVLFMTLGATYATKFTITQLTAYGKGSAVAEEAISSIRQVAAFGIREKLAKRYDEHLEIAKRPGIKARFAVAFMIAGLMWTTYLSYGLAFWQGTRFFADTEITLSSVITILLAMVIGAFALGNVAPNVQTFATSVAAADKVYNTIARESPLDALSESGTRLDNVQGSVSLKDVVHVYPSRPDVVTLDSVSLDIPAGKTTAIVGPSGSGKSTIGALLERFYEPIKGQILVDGHDISTLNISSLRSTISYVSQEPVLFDATIFDNIRHGLPNADDSKSVEDRIVNAAKQANAYDFITALPDGFSTNVGERGSILSGGQKQRIAIARAIVKDPKILILDEATSALDPKSEIVVQQALDAASKGRTTIAIAHRLSTIKNADNIVVMAGGRIIEQGTHDHLLSLDGTYCNLAKKQQMDMEKRNAIEEVKGRISGKEETADTRDAEKYSLSDGKESDSSSKLEHENAAEESNQTSYSFWEIVCFVASFNRQEWYLMLLGFLMSIAAGAGNPVQSVFFAQCIAAMSLSQSSLNDIQSQINFWSAMYLMLGFVALIAWFGQGACFAFCSERLVYRVRDRAFRAILNQDMAFFDGPGSSTGALTASLSTGATALAGVSGVTLGTILVVSSTLVGGIILSLVVGWKLALVCTATIPIVLACGWLRLKSLTLLEIEAKEASQASATYACEAASAIKTVASLNLEQHVWTHYHDILEKQRRVSLRSLLKSSTLYAASQSFVFLCAGLAFWYGGQLLSSDDDRYSILQFFICFASLIAGAQSAGTIFSFAPDISKAKQAGQEFKALLSRKPAIDSSDPSRQKLDKVEGAIGFHNVRFTYPGRARSVLDELNLSVQPGQYVALVGPSGCGKSTTIGLLERLFDPQSGCITLDGHPITSLNIASYRSHLGLVAQESLLYEGTIRDNILLGTAEPDSEVSEARVITACKEANIYEFIESLPDGLDTQVGSRGGLLSGGQKQRIAIARALLRNPKVLLLDEATSALDSEAEKIVQEALEKAAKGRTTIAVAHRLSSVQRADCICVFESGRIVEKGTHQELMELGGRYSELVKLQSLERTE